MSDTTDQGIGTRAADLGAWDKLQLGWLDYEIVVAGQNRTLDLGPHEYNSAKAQGVVVVLPQKSVAHDIGAPAAGTKQWWSGTDDDYDATLTRSLAIPAGTTTLSFQARWNIEDCGTTPCDYGYVEVDDGTGFKAIPGTITKAAEANGIDGYQATYTPATFDLSAYAGKTVQLRLRYKTDGAAQGQNPNAEAGFFADEIKVTNGTTTVFSDGAESRRQRLDGGRLDRGRPGRSTRCTTSSTSRPTARTRATTSTCRRARTTSGSRASRTRSSTSRTRTACSSPTGTRARATTTSPSTRARA